MSNARFRFSANILKRLGEELNPSPDQSILELVKNSYDADAGTCTIELVNADRPGGTLHIKDDGDGMNVDDIVNGWLVLGKSTKTQNQRTRLGRIRAGSKGLGRLAALRMGKVVTLLTRPRKALKDQYRLRIDWTEFDNVDLVDEVKLSIGHAIGNGGKQGTDILIEDLRTGLSRADVQRLARALVLLADPFGDDPRAFRPVLHVPEFQDLEQLVQSRYFNDAEYHLNVRVDKKGKAKASVVDFLGKTLYSADHSELSADGRSYSCPPAEFDLWAFILNKPTFQTRSSSIKEVRTWLQSFGGVHLYENGLRVSPYGNPGNDWLEMNLARVKSPEERPSTNNSIGRVSVGDSEHQLIQKTDRSGFIETDAFLEVQRFAKDGLAWMAKKRMDEAERRRTVERTEAPSQAERAKEVVKDAIDKVTGKSKEAVKLAFDRYDRAKAIEIKVLRKEIQLYRTLSTAGITAGTFAHESAGNPLKVITHAIKTVARRGRKGLGKKYENLIGEPVNMIMKSTDALKVLGNVTMSLLDHEKRRNAKVDIHMTIHQVIKMFEPFLLEREVVVTTKFASGSPFLRGSEAAVEAIVTNLLNNSLIWLEQNHSTERAILIRTKISENIITIRVADNGPGIKDISKNDVWLPGQTTRPNGTGLGLTIVRDTVKDLGGFVEAIENSEMGGAEIVIELPIIGA